MDFFELSEPRKPAPLAAFASIESHPDIGASISSPSCPSLSSSISPSSPPNTGVSLLRESSIRNTNTIAEEQSEETAQLDSRPVYFELDSANIQRQIAQPPVPSLSNTSQTGQDLGQNPDSIHPESLRPGSFPSGVKSAQRQKLTRVQSGDAFVVSIGQLRVQSLRPSPHDHPSRPRATMNATTDDVESNRHVNSWSHL